MRTLIENITELNHYLLFPYLNKDGIAIDATCGNGNDTLYLCQYMKFVYGFDIQLEAILNTHTLLQQHSLNNYQLEQSSFIQLDRIPEREVDMILFNLGYRPKGDKSITTKAEESMVGIQKACNLIKPGGIVSIVTYWGHEEGKQERAAILPYIQSLDAKHFYVIYLKQPNNDAACPPEIILILRKS